MRYFNTYPCLRAVFLTVLLLNELIVLDLILIDTTKKHSLLEGPLSILRATNVNFVAGLHRHSEVKVSCCFQNSMKLFYSCYLGECLWKRKKQHVLYNSVLTMTLYRHYIHKSSILPEMYFCFPSLLSPLVGFRHSKETDIWVYEQTHCRTDGTIFCDKTISKFKLSVDIDRWRINCY